MGPRKPSVKKSPQDLSTMSRWVRTIARSFAKRVRGSSKDLATLADLLLEGCSETEALAHMKAATDSGAGVESREQKGGRSAVCLAVEKGYRGLVTELLRAGADPRIPDNYGRTPLHMAVREQSLEMAMELLDAGADVNARCNFQLTPLHIAAATVNESMCDALIDRGAELNALSVKNQYPENCSDSRLAFRLTGVYLAHKLRGLRLGAQAQQEARALARELDQAIEHPIVSKASRQKRMGRSAL